jgi:3-oxoacyl-[acyl-carrier-protein] synthase-3
MSLAIAAVEHFIPETYVTIEEQYTNYGLTAAETKVFTRFYGINKIPASAMSMQEMLVKVARPLLKNIDVKKIQFVIIARTAPVTTPIGKTLNHSVCAELGLSHTLNFTLAMNKCVSTLRAFEVAEKLLATTKDSYALLLTGETVFTLHNRVLPNITVAGDAAAACLLTSDSGKNHHLHSLATEIHGQYAKGSWMPIAQVREFGGIFNESMQSVIEGAMAKAGINWQQLKLILPHNVNLPCWRGFAKYSGIPLSKIYLNNVANSSHCFNSDLLINLSTALQQKALEKGDYYLMATVGVGAMFGAAVFQY